jgi:hypothetical protein
VIVVHLDQTDRERRSAASATAPGSAGTVATTGASSTGEATGEDSKPAAATVVAKQESVEGVVAEARAAAPTTTANGDAKSVPALASGSPPLAAKDVPFEKAIAAPALTATRTVDDDDDAKPAARVVETG